MKVRLLWSACIKARVSRKHWKCISSPPCSHLCWNIKKERINKKPSASQGVCACCQSATTNQHFDHHTEFFPALYPYKKKILYSKIRVQDFVKKNCQLNFISFMKRCRNNLPKWAALTYFYAGNGYNSLKIWMTHKKGGGEEKATISRPFPK